MQFKLDANQLAEPNPPGPPLPHIREIRHPPPRADN
jgi:hypothetical protein